MANIASAYERDLERRREMMISQNLESLRSDMHRLSRPDTIGFNGNPEAYSPNIDVREMGPGHVQVMVTYSTGRKFAKDFFLSRQEHNMFNSPQDYINTPKLVDKRLLKLFI